MSGKKKMDNRMNLCTVTLNVSPEAYGEDAITEEFSCVKDGFSVQACKWYKPFRGSGDVPSSPFECRFFDRGCTCEIARRYAKQRATRLLKKMLDAKK